MAGEGYLILKPEGDEVHIYYIDYKPIFKKLKKLLNTKSWSHEVEVEIIETWYGFMDKNPTGYIRYFTQTFCREKWPFNNLRILDTLCLP